MAENLDETEICSSICENKCCRSTPPALTSLDFERIKKITEEKNWYSKLDQKESRHLGQHTSNSNRRG